MLLIEYYLISALSDSELRLLMVYFLNNLIKIVYFTAIIMIYDIIKLIEFEFDFYIFYQINKTLIFISNNKL